MTSLKASRWNDRDCNLEESGGDGAVGRSHKNCGALFDDMQETVSHVGDHNKTGAAETNPFEGRTRQTDQYYCSTEAIVYQVISALGRNTSISSTAVVSDTVLNEETG